MPTIAPDDRDRDVVLVAAAAVDAETAVPEVREPVVVEAAAGDSRLQPDDPDRIAAGERQLLDVLGFDRLAQRDVALETRRFSRDRDCFGQRSGLEREVDRQRSGGIELDVVADRFLESLQLGPDRVAAGRQVGKRIKPCTVADGCRRNLRLVIGDGDRGARHHAPLGIPHATGDLSPIELRCCRYGEQQQSGARDHRACRPPDELPHSHPSR
jgi:hypothetical protein